MNKRKTYLVILCLSTTVWLAGEARAQTYTGNSNIQFLYGINTDADGSGLATITLEHFGLFGAFEQFGFTDFLYSTGGAFDIYTEWYSKISFGRATGRDLAAGPLADVLWGAGLNALWLDLDDHLVFLTGPAFQFAIPGFDLFQLETYLYSHRDFESTYQFTYSWDASLSIVRARGFIDFIGGYGPFDPQVVTQPQLLLDVGRLWGPPNRIFGGAEWRYWHNPPGLESAEESIIQLNILFTF